MTRKKSSAIVYLIITAVPSSDATFDERRLPTVRGGKRKTSYIQRVNKLMESRQPNSKNRPPIPDNSQRDKIRKWNDTRRSSSSIESTFTNVIRSHQSESTAYRHIESHQQELHIKSHSNRVLQESMMSLHAKTPSVQNAYGKVTVEQGLDLGFQVADAESQDSTTSSTTSTSTTSTSTSTTTTTTTSIKEVPVTQAAQAVEDTSSKNNPFYPRWASSLQSGVCINNGRQPERKTRHFLFDTQKDCCNAWFYDVDGCMDGLANVNENGDLVKRDTESGKLLTKNSTIIADDGESASSSFAGSISSSSTSSEYFKFYPSFNMDLYSNGACLADGNEPASYSLTPGEYLFDTQLDCCTKWFVDVDLCMGIESSSTNAPAIHFKPTTFPTWDLGSNNDSPWPTWSDDVFSEFDSHTSEISSTVQATSIAQKSEMVDPPSDYTFFDSFENGDFSSYPWSLTTSAPSSEISIDQWAADRTVSAYDGNYAARPGILSEAGSVTNLTISLNDLDGNNVADGAGFKGGLLSFAIHASVDLPVDALYFCINSNIIHVFDSVTGDNSGDWDEVSTLLLPGEHTLTWSYQYYGMPEDESEVDPHRVGNSWIDAVALISYTGDYVFPDENSPTSLFTNNGAAPWILFDDSDAYDGTKSYIAYSQDIVANQGFVEMSWTIIVGPDGGTVSFASFASIYVPHDVLEFSVDNFPMVAVTIPSYSWEVFDIELDPGKHVCTWRLVKNQPGLEESVIKGVDVPSDYQGYVKIDGIKYTENKGAETDMTTAATSLDITPKNTQTSYTLSTVSSSSATDTDSITETTESPMSETTKKVESEPTDAMQSESNVITKAEATDAALSVTTQVVQSKITETTASETSEETVSETTETPGSETTETPVSETSETPGSVTNEGTVSEPTEATESETTEGTVSGTTEGTVSGTTVGTVSGTTEATVSGTTETTVSGTTDGTVSGTTETTVSETTETTVSDTTEAISSNTTETIESENTTATGSEITAATGLETSEATGINTTDIPVALSSSEEGCPEGLQSVDGLPGCCVDEPSYLGDGACDPWEPYNTESCAYDLGDCCHETCNEDSFYGCHTKDGAEYGPFGFFCIDPRYSVIDIEKCQVENREWIGDGGCDSSSEYNTAECGYDGGDCCEETCDQDFAFWTCGEKQPYECISGGEGLLAEVTTTTVSNTTVNDIISSNTTTTVNDINSLTSSSGSISTASPSFAANTNDSVFTSSPSTSSLSNSTMSSSSSSSGPPSSKPAGSVTPTSA